MKNERRQNYENRPYGMAHMMLQPAVFPAPHPYNWTTIGSPEDLDNASLDDVKSFFRRFYTPNNASLAIVGDFDPDAARALVENYFGDIAPWPPRRTRPANGLIPLRRGGHHHPTTACSSHAST